MDISALLHTFCMDGRTFVLDVNHCLSFEVVDDVVADILVQYKDTDAEDIIQYLDGKYEPDKLTQTIEAIEWINDLRKSGPSPPYAPPPDFGISNINLSAVLSCNLRCTYCRARSSIGRSKIQRMSKETVKQVLDFFAPYLARSKGNIGVFFALSGEPLLDFPLFTFLVRCCEELEQTLSRKVGCTFTTNGTLLSDEVMAFVREQNIPVQVSLDGPRDIHDAMRPFPDGTGTYDVIMDNLASVGNGIQSVEATLTGANPDVVGIITHLIELGFTSIALRPVIAPYDESFAINPETIERVKEGYTEYAYFLAERIVDRDEAILAAINPVDFFGRFLLRVALRTKIPYRCPGGKSVVVVAPDGGIYPCDAFIDLDECRMGTIATGVDEVHRQRFLELDVDHKASCKHCWARYFCGGGCYAAAQVINSQIESPDPVRCELVKHLIELAILVCGNLRDQDPEAYLWLREKAEQTQ